jgi:hypothetical protein
MHCTQHAVTGRTMASYIAKVLLDARMRRGVVLADC